MDGSSGSSDGGANDGCAREDACGNGDEDCDGRVDEGCACGVPIVVAVTSLRSEHPSLAWTGDGFGVVWHEESPTADERRLFYRRLARDGTPEGDPIPMGTDFESSDYGRLLWNGTALALVWGDSRHEGASEIYFAHLGISGALLETPRRLTESSGEADEPSLVWTGTEYGLAYTDQASGTQHAYFMRLTSDGAPIGAPVLLSGAASSNFEARIAWSGSGYAVAWHGEEELNSDMTYVRRVAETFTAALGPAADDPSIVAMEGLFSAVYESEAVDAGDLVMVTQGTDMTLAVRGLVTGPGEADEPAAVWSGEELGVAFEAPRDGDNDVWFGRFDSEGNALDGRAPGPVVTTAADSLFPSLVWADGSWAVAWQEQVGGSADYDINFAWICL